MSAKADSVLAQALHLHDSRKLEPALSMYRRYLQLEPGHVEAWVCLGGLLIECGQPEEARAALVKALDLAPQRIETRLILARFYTECDQFKEAENLLQPALRQNADNQKLHELLRFIYQKQQKWDQLHAEFVRSLDLHPSKATGWEKACLNLLFGNMPAAWDEYELRWSAPGIDLRPPSHVLPQPRWQGESFVGKTLLLRWEQGFGDILMFARYAPLVKARGGRVLLEVLPPLAALLATCPGIDEVVRDGDPLPPFDLQLPLLSLPRIFRTDLASIPAEIPYLSVPDQVPHREGIDRILAATKGLTRIGLVWAGSPKHPRDSERSIPAALLGPFEAIPGVAWHSFHMESGTEHPFPGIIPMGPVVCGDFADTAHALVAMDLLITVDTATAHLAGALGLPTLLLITAHPDWRWLMGRDDSPWYPTMRLYRQPKAGDWPSVIQRVVTDLTAES